VHSWLGRDGVPTGLRYPVCNPVLTVCVCVCVCVCVWADCDGDIGQHECCWARPDIMVVKFAHFPRVQLYMETAKTPEYIKADTKMQM
jgi:hypothetical protein